MRFDKPVYFQTVKKGLYDAVTGDYSAETVSEVEKYASVTHSGAETINLVYGSIKQGSRVVRLQRPYTEPFDFIRIDGKRYRVDSSRPLREKHVFVVSEVQ